MALPIDINSMTATELFDAFKENYRRGMPIESGTNDPTYSERLQEAQGREVLATRIEERLREMLCGALPLEPAPSP